jgi:acyl dehydratase
MHFPRASRRMLTMTIDPTAVGSVVGPVEREWTDLETMLYALGVGAGTDELALTTENSHGIDQQVLPTFAVVLCADVGGLRTIGEIDYGAVVHAGQAFRLSRPLRPTGRLRVSSEVTAIHDKGSGQHAIIEITTRGIDCDGAELVAEASSTVLIRGAGGFAGQSTGTRSSAFVPERRPDVAYMDQTTKDQALLYRLSGDRNPLHSDQWFASTRAGFPRPILHGLCTYGFAGRALVHGLCGGDANKLRAMSGRFSAPVYPGESLLTEVWITSSGSAQFRTAAVGDEGRRDVITNGTANYLE